MRKISFRFASGLFALLLCVSAASSVQAQDKVSDELDKLMARMPVKTAAEKAEIADKLLALGEAGVRELCARIKNSDEPLDGKVLSTLHGLVHVAGRSGAEDARKMLAGVFGDILRSKATIAAKSYLITELRTLGRVESVGPVGALLGEKELCEPAAQTLVSIGGAEAAAALRDALPRLKGRERVTVIFALGRLGDRKAVPLLLKDAASADAAIRHAALFALANAGDPAAGAVLRKAAATGDAGECERAHHRLLRFARALAKNDNKQEAAAICRELLAQDDPDDSGIAPGAFSELMGFLEKDEALTAVVAGLGHESARVRTAAARVAAELPGADVTRRLAEALVKLAPARRGPLVELLRQRGDPAALQSVLQALNDSDQSVRIAAMAAVGGLGKRDVAPQLIAFLDKTPEESEAARSALIAMGDKTLNAALVEALPKAAPDARCGLLTVLAGRDSTGHRDVFLSRAEDQDESVRQTALKILGSLDDEQVPPRLMTLLAKTESADERKVLERSLLGACRKLSEKSHKKISEQLIREHAAAAVPVRCALVGAVRCMADGHPKGLAHVRAARNDDAPEVRSAALRALVEWPTPEPMDDLLKSAKETKDLTEHVLALRGCIRMAGQYAASIKKDDRDKALEVLGLAMAATRRPEEKRQVLGAVSAMGRPEALKIAVNCLDDDALSVEAAAAAVTIGLALCQPTQVLVAFDKRASALPDWLKGWRDTGMQLETTDTGFKIYSNPMPQTKIALGGNKAPGASSHYIVILTGLDSQAPAVAPAMKKVLQVAKDKDLRKQAEKLIGLAEKSSGPAKARRKFRVAKVSTGSGCKVAEEGLKNGARVYIDRDYTFKKIPPELAGAPYVMTANGDSKCGDKEYLTLLEDNN